MEGQRMHQYHLKRVVHAVVSAACLSTAITVLAQTPADNTKVNSRDRAKGEVTADQQKENAGDREIASKIRKSLVSDKSLSTYAHNVKVVAQDGQVTLKGPVRSEDEKRSVAAKAAAIVGAAHVTNEISIAPAPAKPAKQ
jgi:hyperosmotically inducible periplasmic protein